jgi:RNA polymerase sigma-70 factor (ECF subfamily)
MSPSERHDPQVLLAHLGWLRDLARQLVVDQHTADDVAQDAAVAALESTPGDASSLHGWLRGVVHNLALRRARAEYRREDYELRQAPHAVGEGTEALVEQVEAQGELVRQVLGLPEPYRDVVLLHYFEDLSARRIAAHLGLVERTVHKRLAHAHGLLRKSLERSLGKDPHVWSLALLGVPLAGLARKGAVSASPLAWPLALATGGVAVVAAVTLVVLGTGADSSESLATATPQATAPSAKPALASVGPWLPVRMAVSPARVTPPSIEAAPSSGAGPMEGSTEELPPEERDRIVERLRSALEAALEGSLDVGVFVEAARLVVAVEADPTVAPVTDPDGTRVYALPAALPGVTARLCVKTSTHPDLADPALTLRLELPPAGAGPELAVGAVRRLWLLELDPRADRDGRVDHLGVLAELPIAAGASYDLGIDLQRRRTPLSTFLHFSPDAPATSRVRADWIDQGATGDGDTPWTLVGGALPDRPALQHLQDRLRELHAALAR